MRVVVYTEYVISYVSATVSVNYIKEPQNQIVCQIMY